MSGANASPAGRSHQENSNSHSLLIKAVNPAERVGDLSDGRIGFDCGKDVRHQILRTLCYVLKASYYFAGSAFVAARANFFHTFDLRSFQRGIGNVDGNFLILFDLEV